jgi:ActD protein
MKSQHKEVLFGLYNDEVELMSAIKGARAQHLDIMDVYTPFPVHGLDALLELKESRLHVVGFIFGMLGTLTALIGMSWIFTSDWPIIFGGKPHFSLPSFVPIIFETTVLFSAIGMTVVFFIVCGLGFGVNNPILDDRITDDKFCLAFQTNDMKESAIKSLKGFFKNTGAAEVHSKVI